METYKEILDRMRKAYETQSGNRPEDVSDIGLRLQVLAGELYRLDARLDWLRRQAFPHTADGAQLDLHGAQRGVLRKGGEKAEGTLVFSRYVPVEFDLVIPKGTVCASYGGEAVEYETVEEAVLPGGQTSVSVPARAVTGGSAGNAAAGYINTLVTEVSGINYVVNQEAFSGGSDPEGDEDYRRRILEDIGSLASFGTAGYYEALALETEGISSAQAVNAGEGGAVTVYVWGSGKAPDGETIAQVQAKLDRERPAGVTAAAQAASAKKLVIGAVIKMKPGVEFAPAKTKLTAAIKEWLLTKRIGESLYMSEVARLILEREPGVARVNFTNATADWEGTPGVVPAAGAVTVTEASS